MTAEIDRQRRAFALFEEVVDLHATVRATRLRDACGQDADLRARINALLAADDADQDPFVHSVAQWGAEVVRTQEATEDQGQDPMLGRSIGAWQITGLLGRGGMGNVYAVERADGAYRQSAALKLIRHGTYSPQARDRLLQERQMLAGLQHPNIARLLDGGFSQEGDPFFVMERVDGQHIDQWCDAQRLDPRQRVALFLQVLEAVQCAHRNLVVHRDLKPSNILVTDTGEVKLLDFGIARNLETQELTRTYDRACTLEYTAPEQLRGAAVTTAVDVYQLGIVLYKLLSGLHPFGIDSSAPMSRQLQLIGSHPVPVTRRSEELAPHAATRSCTPAALSGVMRGTLGKIVNACLRQEPSERYSSVETLSHDLQAWLQDRPVSVVKISARRAVQLWLRRNRALAAAVAATCTALVLGIAFVLWQTHQARRQAEIVQRANLNARAALSVLTNTLSSAQPDQTLDKEFTARELLANAEKQLDSANTGDPLARQSVQRMLAKLYSELGDVAKASRLYAAGLRGVRPEDRESALRLAEHWAAYSGVLANQEHGPEAQATALYAKALIDRYALEDNGQKINVLTTLSRAYLANNMHAKAKQTARDSLSIAKAMPHPPLNETLQAYAWYCEMLMRQKNPDQDYPLAADMAAEGLRFADTHEVPENAPMRAELLASRGEALILTHRTHEAENTIRRAIRIREETSGAQGVPLANLYALLSEVENDLGRYREAIAHLERSIALNNAAMTVIPPLDAASSINQLAYVNGRYGDYAKAHQLAVAALATIADQRGANADIVRRSLRMGEAGLLGRMGHPAKAREKLVELTEDVARAGEGEQFFQGNVLYFQATVELELGNLDQTEKTLNRARAIFVKLVPRSHPVFMQMQQVQAELTRQRGNLAEAERLQREVLDATRRFKHPNEDAEIEVGLARILFERKQYREARELLDIALPVLRTAVLPQQHDRALGERLDRQLRSMPARSLTLRR